MALRATREISDWPQRTAWAAIAALIFLAGLGASQAGAGPGVGDAAPEFALKTLGGDTRSLTELRKQGHVLLVFWSVDCAYCLAEVPSLNALQERYAGKGLAVAAINIAAETEIEIRDYVRDYGVNYLVFSDRGKNLDVVDDYGVFATPTLVLVSPAGAIEYYGHKVPDVGKWVSEAQ